MAERQRDGRAVYFYCGERRGNLSSVRFVPGHEWYGRLLPRGLVFFLDLDDDFLCNPYSPRNIDYTRP